MGFADEEGLRFGTTYLGSAAFTGRFEPRLLAVRDADGVTLADAVRAFGGDPDALAGHAGPDGVLGYCEVHIEQGPVLERRDLPVGVVTAIAGQSRIAVTCGARPATPARCRWTGGGTRCAPRPSSSSRSSAWPPPSRGWSARWGGSRSSPARAT